MTGICAWLGGSFARECQQDSHSSIAMQGGGQAVHPELELAVDCCSELQHWDFDPMLVEVEACRAKRPPLAGLTCQAVSEVAQAVDLCLLGSDEFCSGQTSPRLSLLEPEQAGGSPPPVQVDFPAIQEGADGGSLAILAAVGRAPDTTTAISTEDFITAFKEPLTTPVLSSPPRLRLNPSGQSAGGGAARLGGRPQEER
jgi:hypothetical protein